MSHAVDPIPANHTRDGDADASKVKSVGVPLGEIVAVVLFAATADMLLFREQGYAATAAFGLVFVVLLSAITWFRRNAPSNNSLRSSRDGLASLVLLATLGALLARLVWLGSGWTVLSTAMVAAAVALSFSGRAPDVLHTLTLVFMSPVLGIDRLKSVTLRRQDASNSAQHYLWAAWLVPLIVTAVFGCVFVLANPEIFTSVSQWFQRLGNRISIFFQGVSAWELPFCIVAALVGAGLLRPLAPRQLPKPIRELFPTVFTNDTPTSQTPTHLESEETEAADTTVGSTRTGNLRYAVSRNTLVAVIVAFALYLPFEFATLWRQQFPDGFYYAGYAHQGAAWLTVALVLATVVLSVVFSASNPVATGVRPLRRLAWIWSALNGLLAIAVFNRLMIYVGYNGMTQMRTVGFFGITLVVIGFVLVMCKIKYQRSFAWLIRSQLLAFAGAVVAYSVFPVDYVAHRYNVSKVLSGDLKPSVMIAVKTINDEGCLPLCDLVDVNDPIIRDGVRAILARQVFSIRRRPARAEMTWHEYQGATSRLTGRLMTMEQKWMPFYDDLTTRKAAIDVFVDYAMQWY